MFAGKKVTFCVCGSLFAYRIPEVVLWLKEHNAKVQVALSAAALDFVTPRVMAGLSGNAVAQDIFTLDEKWRAIHIDIAACDLFVIAPADQGILAKIALGVADDLIGAAFLATVAPVLILPAPDIDLKPNGPLADNLALLSGLGHHLIGGGGSDELLFRLKERIGELLGEKPKNHISYDVGAAP